MLSRTKDKVQSNHAKHRNFLRFHLSWTSRGTALQMRRPLPHSDSLDETHLRAENPWSGFFKQASGFQGLAEQSRTRSLQWVCHSLQNSFEKCRKGYWRRRGLSSLFQRFTCSHQLRGGSPCPACSLSPHQDSSQATKGPVVSLLWGNSLKNSWDISLSFILGKNAISLNGKVIT